MTGLVQYGSRDSDGHSGLSGGCGMDGARVWRINRKRDRRGRRRNAHHCASGLLTGSILAALPSVAVAIAVGVGAIGLRILLGREGKGGWDLPTWGDDIQFAAMLAGGAAGARLTGSSFQPGRRYKSTLAWMLVGGMAGPSGRSRLVFRATTYCNPIRDRYRGRSRFRGRGGDRCSLVRNCQAHHCEGITNARNNRHK